MLMNLLKEMAMGGINSKTMLASYLGVSEDMLVSMIENLEQMGYIEPVYLNHCGNNCNSCHISNNYSNKKTANMWCLTPKGTQLARTNSSLWENEDKLKSRALIN